MFEIIKDIPRELTDFILVTIISLIIGLEQRKVHELPLEKHLFGTDRTFTFIGMLGYILIIAFKPTFTIYIVGFIVLSVFLSISYFYKIKETGDYGLTTILIALLTYCIPLLLVTQPLWLFLLVVVTILIFTELKESLLVFSQRFDREEFITLAKFLVMAGVILPIVPNTPIVPYLSITPYKIWAAVVVISSVSYISYLLRKFVFKGSGILLSGILGGLYSSTATTFVLSRKLKLAQSNRFHYMGAIVMATGMMYLRVGLLLIIFNKMLFMVLKEEILILVLLSFITGGALAFFKKEKQSDVEQSFTDKNPLEFKVAVIFTVIYVVFTYITWYAINSWGESGLKLLAGIVGITDIDPLLLSLFQGKYNVSVHTIVSASFIAIISNNIAKMCYACFLSGKNNRIPLIIGFSSVIIGNIIILLLI